MEIRASLGYTREYTERIDLVSMTPQPDLCSTGYCLANPAATGAEYLVFLPAGEKIARILDKLGFKNAPAVDLPGEGVLQVDLAALSYQSGFRNLTHD